MINMLQAIRNPKSDVDEFFDKAFQGMSVPENIRKLSMRLCDAYNIRGLADPGYIANVIAVELGLGDGKGNFNVEDIPAKAALKQSHDNAWKWWRNLSNNQMKDLEKKYFPNSRIHGGMVYEMWTEEGEPEPQALIPVTQ